MFRAYRQETQESTLNMSSPIKESKLVVPADLVRKSCGLSIDMGGSVFKAIYRSKENAQESEKDKNSKTGHLTFVSVSGSRVREALDHLSTVVQIKNGPEPPLVHTTGLGCTVYGNLITEKLHVKLENTTEFDCFANALQFLSKHLSRSDLFETFDATAAEKPLAVLKQSLAVLKATQDEGKTAVTADGGLEGMFPLGQTLQDSVLPVAEVEKDLYPCVLAMLGSGLGYLVLNADGTFRLIDGSPSGGLNFLGLGSLLTECKTFDELIDLASKGNAHNIDIYSNELLQMYNLGDSSTKEAAGGDDSIYTKAAKAEGTLIYGFGKCVAKKTSDFKKEDIARALLDKFVMDIAHTSMLVTTSAGLERIVFSGSFVGSSFIRHLVTAECAKRNMYRSMAKKAPVKFDFLKAGPHLGAIGALVTNYEKNAASTNL